MTLLVEANDSVSPNSAGFSSEGGRAEWTFYCRGDEVEPHCLSLLGSVKPEGDGTLLRNLPKVHPQYPWMVATTINIRGQGVKMEGASGEPITALNNPTNADMLLLPAATAQYMRYVIYDLATTFEAVPYNLYPDSDIVMTEDTWKDDTGTTKTFTWANENIRFVDWPRFPATEFMQFRHGSMFFRTASGAAPGGFAFPGMQRIPMRKQMLKAMWYRVPQSYVTHAASYLDRFLWRVNQNSVTWGGETYEPGQLLYAGYAFPKRNNPPFPAPDPEFPGFFLTEKILDIELSFVVCRWSDATAPTPANGNWVAAGHNLQISTSDRLPHYVTTDAPLITNPSPPPAQIPDPSKMKPTYFSCPMELIWTDPGFVQDIGTLLQ